MSFSRRVRHMDRCPWSAPRRARRRDGISAVALSRPAAGRTSRACDSGLIFGLIRLRSPKFIGVRINAATQVTDVNGIRRTIIQTSENRKVGGSTPPLATPLAATLACDVPCSQGQGLSLGLNCPLLGLVVWVARLLSGVSPATRHQRSTRYTPAAQCAGLVVAQWVGSCAQQLAGVGVEEHQRGIVDADADPAAAEELRGKQPVLTEGDQATWRDDAVDFQGCAGVDQGQQ
jgi:hypothetical protein